MPLTLCTLARIGERFDGSSFGVLHFCHTPFRDHAVNLAGVAVLVLNLINALAIVRHADPTHFTVIPLDSESKIITARPIDRIFVALSNGIQ
jgi:hypothetical protein